MNSSDTIYRRTGVTAVVFNKESEILLQKRVDNGDWALPGGAIDIGESAEEAVIREVREETGYAVFVVRLIGIYSDPEYTTITYPDGNTAKYVSILFECKISGGTATTSEESSEVGWFNPNHLPQPFHRNHEPRIHDAMENQIAAFYR
jgi:ADP-ribose pyrophosphatase YjhB (NUDIX family)